MNQITLMIRSARWLLFRFRDVISWGRERCNGTSAFPDSFMIFILLFYSCFTLISFSYFSAMTLFYFVFTISLLNTRWRIQTPCLNHPPFPLYVIHFFVSRYYSIIFTSRKYLFLPTLFPEELNETRLVFPRIPYVARAKSKKYKTPTQKLFGTHSHPVNSLTFIRVLFLILFPFAINIFMFKNSSELNEFRSS
jgi:hypothetical protein